ncbi:tetratricopeptide repeat protein [Rubripirellula lacrimiformis]|uniref:Tetratricopeptide repeat protein n=1 Tax=Rubripirellula lacrimiformis TaxID=1930273 RepID=A0A517NFJ2_9BACT|nr:tetratricopeptide repeat protein [Rubripirellula lacrimiformis]QDT05828.1 tetratricopeptide repeat protein [Rubripirellula lacrimiformis]
MTVCFCDFHPLRHPVTRFTSLVLAAAISTFASVGHAQEVVIEESVTTAQDSTPAEESDASGDQTAAAEKQDASAKSTPATTASPDKSTAGQSELDEAIIKRIDAESNDELEAVGALLESALKKGLDEENSSFAKQMLGSVLFQRAQGLAQLIVQNNGRRRMEVREEAILVLKQAVDYDPTLVEAYLLIARLNLLPGGSREEITEATSKAIELLDDNPREKSAALVLRALTQQSNEDKLADLDAAVEADSDNNEARQARAAMNLQTGDVEGAMEDLESILTKDPTNQAIAGAAVQKLVELERLDEAMKLITKMLAAKPSEGMYRMRAILHRANDDSDEAMADLNKAVALAPRDPLTLLQRAALALDRKDVKSAKADFAAALQIEPRITMADEAIELRLQIAAFENRMADAINDAQLLVDKDPSNLFRRLRLASLYTMDKRPRKAIDILSSILQDDPTNVAVLRTRGDALLSVGDHSSAIDDYEKSIESIGNIDVAEVGDQVKAEASGIYNNLAWVMATSPNESVRNGKRAVELAEMSAELTEYKEAHILSTLAAAYAEIGDFEAAKKWSKKAVELATEDEHVELEQLQNELKTYQDGKPWREKQETEENEVPILSPDDLIDT